MATDSIPLSVEFTSVAERLLFLNTKADLYSGGLELLFSNERMHKLAVPKTDENGQPSNVAFLVRYLCENLMKDTRKEMFLLEDHV